MSDARIHYRPDIPANGHERRPADTNVMLTRLFSTLRSRRILLSFDRIVAGAVGHSKGGPIPWNQPALLGFHTAFDVELHSWRWLAGLCT